MSFLRFSRKSIRRLPSWTSCVTPNPQRAKNESSVPMAIAGAYGILRFSGLACAGSGSRRTPRRCPTEERSPAPANKSLKKPLIGSPAQDHDPPGQRREKERPKKLHRANPGSDRGAQFHVPAAGPAHQERYAIEQQAQRQPGHALAKAMPAKPVTAAVPAMAPRGRRDHNPCQQERKDQPVGDAAAAQIRVGRHGEYDHGWPPSESVHLSYPSPPQHTGRQSQLR